MQYISFYKDRLPFKPKTNVVIYFDVTQIGQKRFYEIFYNDRIYNEVIRAFRHYGLEFCFLPKIASHMELDKIYHYFNPQAGPNDHVPYIRALNDRDLLEYVVEDFDQDRLAPGLIQYKGEGFDTASAYIYSYTPLPHNLDNASIEFIERYGMEHGVGHNFFSRGNMVDAKCEFFFDVPDERSRMAPLHSIISRKTDSYGARSIEREEPSVEDMMSEVQMLVERLRQSGIGELALRHMFEPTQKLSRMRIRYGRIFLTDYNNMEIRMHPLSKAIYLLFLRHPEGIQFSYLPDYRSELLQMYELISGRDNREDICRSIDDVTDPTRNSINEKCSRIKQAFLREFDDSIARNYYITGGRGEAKKILIPREMVTWE